MYPPKCISLDPGQANKRVPIFVTGPFGTMSNESELYQIFLDKISGVRNDRYRTVISFSMRYTFFVSEFTKTEGYL